MRVWRERPGVISIGPCWCYLRGCYLYTAAGPLRLLWQIVTQWQDDRHIAG